MSLPDQTPKLPKLPFLIGDAILLGAAWYIANRTPAPLNVSSVTCVTVCVVFAAILGAIPFLTDYARKQDEALDERQRGLEALSRTINSAAEQISIAANGLNELTDLSHKNLKQAEQLPHKLQDKIAEFNAQLDNARENDREELEKELVELRTSETERLQSISEKIHKAIGELSRLDATTQEHVAKRTEQAEAIQRAIAKAQESAARALQETTATLAKQLGTAQGNALAEIDRKLAERTSLAVAVIESAVVKAIDVTRPSAEPGASAEQPANPPADSTGVVESASPPKRPRKVRREDVVVADPAAPESTAAASEVVGLVPAASQPPHTVTTSVTGAPTLDSPPPFFEPPPVPAEAIAQIQPVAPASAEPFPIPSNASATNAANDATLPPAASVATFTAVPEGVAAEVDRPVRKRAVRKVNAEPTPDLPFEPADDGGGDDQAVTSADLMEQVISSDGATRLIATSYIGIGNRLFIRGNGPGLSWDKGVPLQFISIGKWRWETPEAAAPIEYKLYKNDETECAGLGARTLEPGHQQEVTAKF
ncbi:MAG: hypothetical protein ABIZ04_02350 [Opitutus sp.]